MPDQVRYLGLVERLKQLMYTELTDVEAEINGLMTYDRQVSLIWHSLTWHPCGSAGMHCRGRGKVHPEALFPVRTMHAVCAVV